MSSPVWHGEQAPERPEKKQELQMEERSPCHHNLGQSRGVRGLILPSFSLEPLQPLIMSQQALLKFLSHSPYRPVLPTGRLQQSSPVYLFSSPCWTIPALLPCPHWRGAPYFRLPKWLSLTFKLSSERKCCSLAFLPSDSKAESDVT